MNVGVLEAKNRLSELIEAALRGEEVVITRRGEPAVTLVPAAATTSLREQRTAALAEMRRIGDAIATRNGRRMTIEDLLDARDEGRR